VTAELPSLVEQQAYWDDRWTRQSSPNEYQLQRGETILGILRSIPLRHPEILDLGCGTGWFTARLAEATSGRVTGIDLSETAIASARRSHPGVEFRAANILEIPLPAGHYDVVISQEVLPHVEDPPGYLDLIARILKPSGYLIITSANRFVMERWDHGGPDPDSHLKLYPTRRQFTRMLRRRFRVLRTTNVISVGDRGILRLANSARLNQAMTRLVPQRYVDRFREWAGLGYTLIALAQKP